MLDSLVRVSRRVGGTTDTDTADADAPTSPVTSESTESVGTRERLPTNLPTVRHKTSFTADAYYFQTIGKSVRRNEKDRLRDTCVPRPQSSSLVGLITGRSASPQEMRRTTLLLSAAILALWYRRRFAYRSTESRGYQTAPPFSSKRFHALLNSLFKVLFNFPSRYLFAIGLVVYLALEGVYLPLRAALSSNPTLRRLPARRVQTSAQASHLLWDPLRGSFRSIDPTDRLSFTPQVP